MIRFAAVLFCMFAHGVALGAVSSVVASPSGVQAELSRATSVNVAWIVNTTGPGTIGSVHGTYRTDDGTALGTGGASLTKTVSEASAVTLMETIQIPQNVIVRAHLTGKTFVVYERNFGDEENPVAGSVMLFIIAGGGASRSTSTAIPGSERAFDVSHFALGFGDGAPVLHATAGDAPTVKAKARFTANGIVDGAWQVAGPNPGVSPQYRILSPVKQIVDGTDVIFNSPALPTNKPGLYYLRLEITTPAITFEAPVIRYFVVEKKK
jgi:hypothetical protein